MCDCQMRLNTANFRVIEKALLFSFKQFTYEDTILFTDLYTSH
jgi:hypothetical protein